MMKYYTAMILFSALTMVILSVLAANNDALSKRAKKGIILSSMMIIVASCCEYMGTVLNGGPEELRTVHILVKFLELSLAPVIPVVFANAIYPVKSTKFIAVPLALHTLLEFLSIWFGIIFYVDAGNIYTHCQFYWLYIAAYSSSLVFMIVQVSRFNENNQSQNKLGMTLIMLLLLLGIVWQAIDSSMKVVWLSLSIGDVLFYVLYCDILQQIDALTGLLNRKSYENRIRALTRSSVILFADVDTFKTVNDTFGHSFGDSCLSTVGAALKHAYGKSGLCYRIGGDEFCVILSKNLDDIEKLNSHFFRRLDIERQADPRLPHISVGYADFLPGTMTAVQATAKADEMMYEFKKKSRPGDD